MTVERRTGERSSFPIAHGTPVDVRVAIARCLGARV
jgi:hypothetical protein